MLMHSQSFTAPVDPEAPALPVRDTTRSRGAVVRDLHWLRNLVDELTVLGLVEQLGSDRLLLHVSQAQVNDLQGRDRNSGVVSRRCSRLRGDGVLESSSPLVVRGDLLPPPRYLRPLADSPTHGPCHRGHLVARAVDPLLHDVHRSQAQDLSPETTVTSEMNVTQGSGGEVDEGDGISPHPGCKPDPTATTRYLADALRLACSQMQWDLARRITALIEAFSCSHPTPDFPREPREPRGTTRVHPDDDENSSSSFINEPIDAGSRGSSREIASRGRRAAATFRAERAALTSNETRVLPSVRIREAEDGVYANTEEVAVSAVGTVGGVPAGLSADEGALVDVPTLLQLVEPLRSVCRSRQLTDLDDVDVLRRAFDGWDGLRVSLLVDELVDRLESGAKIRSPFGLLVTLARRGWADPSGMSGSSGASAPCTGSVPAAGRGCQPEVSEPADLRGGDCDDSRIERLRVLTGWVDLDAGRCGDEAPVSVPVVRTRLEHLRGMLNRPSDAVFADSPRIT